MRSRYDTTITPAPRRLASWRVGATWEANTPTAMNSTVTETTAVVKNSDAPTPMPTFAVDPVAATSTAVGTHRATAPMASPAMASLAARPRVVPPPAAPPTARRPPHPQHPGGDQQPPDGGEDHQREHGLVGGVARNRVHVPVDPKMASNAGLPSTARTSVAREAAVGNVEENVAIVDAAVPPKTNPHSSAGRATGEP